jgi:hypothetical protein
MGRQLAFEVEEVTGGFAPQRRRVGRHVGCRMTRLSVPN